MTPNMRLDEELSAPLCRGKGELRKKSGSSLWCPICLRAGEIVPRYDLGSNSSTDQSPGDIGSRSGQVT